MAIDLMKVRELADGQRQVKLTAGWEAAEVLTECAAEIERLRVERDDLVSFIAGVSRQAAAMAKSYAPVEAREIV